jgi:hypothetical protein
MKLTDNSQQWCTWAFPPGKYNAIPKTPDLSQFNKYGAFNLKADRLAFIDGSMLLLPIFLSFIANIQNRH